MTTTPLPVVDVSRFGRQVLDEVGTVVVGMESPLRVALAAILAGGHVLFEDVPGLGKTLAARSLAPVRSVWSSPACSARRTCCRRTSPAPTSTTRPARSSSSGPDRCSPGCCSRTRSTGRRRRRSPRCWRPWPSARSPSRARAFRCPSLST